MDEESVTNPNTFRISVGSAATGAYVSAEFSYDDPDIIKKIDTMLEWWNKTRLARMVYDRK